MTPAGQLLIAAEHGARQAGGAAVLLNDLVRPVKELSGDLRLLSNLYPCCRAGGPAG